MDWSDVGKAAAKAAPLLGTALLGPAGGAVGALIASVFGVEAEPDKVAAAIKADPEAAIKLQQVQNEHEREMRRMVIEAETARLAQVNETYRTEIASGDKYVRRMRPTFGYIVAFSIFTQTLIAVYTIGFRPAQVSDLSTLYEAMAAPLSIALAVLGIYVKKRSDEKLGEVSGGGLLSGLFKK